MIDPRARARATAIAAAVIGLFVATAVVAYSNFGAVLAAMRPIGVAGFLAVIVAQLVLFIPLGLAWWLVAPGEPITRAPIFAWSRLMREAASDVLPFSQLGGLMIAVRSVVLGGTGTPTALGSSLVDVTIEIAAQLVYTLVGVVLLAHRLGLAAARNDRLLYGVLVGMVIGAAIVGGMVATQRRGLNVIGRLLQRLAPSVRSTSRTRR